MTNAERAKITNDAWDTVPENIKTAFNDAVKNGVVLPVTKYGAERAHMELNFHYDLKKVNRKGARPLIIYRLDADTKNYLIEGSLDKRLRPLFKKESFGSLEEVLKHLTKILKEPAAPADGDDFKRWVQVADLGPKEIIPVGELDELMLFSYNEHLGCVHQNVPRGKLPRKYILPIEVKPFAKKGIAVYPTAYPFLPKGAKPKDSVQWTWVVRVKALYDFDDSLNFIRAKVFCGKERPPFLKKVLDQLEKSASRKASEEAKKAAEEAKKTAQEAASGSRGGNTPPATAIPKVRKSGHGAL